MLANLAGVSSSWDEEYDCGKWHTLVHLRRVNRDTSEYAMEQERLTRLRISSTVKLTMIAAC